MPQRKAPKQELEPEVTDSAIDTMNNIDQLGKKNAGIPEDVLDIMQVIGQFVDPTDSKVVRIISNTPPVKDIVVINTIHVPKTTLHNLSAAIGDKVELVFIPNHPDNFKY